MKAVNSISNDLLYENGWQVIRNGFGSDIVDKIVRNYGLMKSSFHPHSGNLSFPYYSAYLHDFLTVSNFRGILNSYFERKYQKPPVLQIIPSIIITYPKYDQKNFDSKEHRFPALWHTDYANEFTVHLPLCDLNQSTPHTKYLQGSSLNPEVYPQKIFKDDDMKTLIQEHETVDCLGQKGDAILIDVTGVHRGELCQAYRAMIQIKFTCGNDILIFDGSNPKYLNSVRILKENIDDYENIRSSIKDSLYFITKNNFEKELSVIPDSVASFKPFLN